MSTNVPATRPNIQAGGQVAALVPQSLDEAFRVAQAIAISGLAPKGMEKPEQVMVAIMAGAELGFAPFQSLQSFAVVNGRPTLWGDGLVAIVRRNGCSIREWHEGETAMCEVVRPDTGETIVRQFSQSDAIKAGLAGKAGPWTQYPQRMRAMRARAWAVRDGCADMLRGFQVAEEVEDYQPIRDVTPATSGLRARLEAAKPTPVATDAEFTDKQELASDLDAALEGDTIPAHDAETGEIIEQDLPGHADEPDDEGFPGDRASPAAEQNPALTWGRDFLAWIPTASPKVITEAWAEAKREGKPAAVQNADPDLFDALIAAKDRRLDEARGSR